MGKKAVLVIDMPTSCSMCRLQSVCTVWGAEQVKWKGYNDRLETCPLKPMPEEKQQGSSYTDEDWWRDYELYEMQND